MTYRELDVSEAVAAAEKYRGGDVTELGAALAVVGLSAERVAKEAQLRDDMIRVAHRSGASLRQLAEVSVRRSGDLVEIRVTANAFLRRMVRSLVALLLEVGRGRMAPERVDGVLTSPRRALHGRAVPARGLTLERVVYQSAINRTTTRSAPRRRRSNDRTGEQGT